jgi:septal ring factor EnvC (AmiA/AmiB activator)
MKISGLIHPLRLARLLPIRRQKRLELERRQLERKFTEEMREAHRQKKSRDERESLREACQWEIDEVQEEIEELFTNDLLEQATRFRVSIPPYFDECRARSDDWRELRTRPGYVLTESGVAKIREQIRAEEKWRMERRAHWFSFVATVVAPMTGLVGAITGLIAVLHKGHGG